MLDEINHPFPNLNNAAIEACEWISNLIQHYDMHVIVYPCWD